MTRKQRRLVLIGSSLGVLALAAALVLSALKDSIVFFNSPTDVVEEARRSPAAASGSADWSRPAPCSAATILRCASRSPTATAPSRSATRASCRTCSARGRAWSPKARWSRRRVQGRFRARQARRELHAEGSRRRAEEAGPLGRGRREEEMIAEIGHYALVLALALALIQSVVPIGGRAAARRYADGRCGADRARAIRVRRGGVCRAHRLLRRRPISRSPTCSRIRIRRCR